MAKKAASTRSGGRGKAGLSAAVPGLDAQARVVVLYGPDEMVRRLRFAHLRDALQQAHGELDPHTFDGRSADLAAVLDEVRGYALMASYKLVVVDDAEEWVKRYRDALERYAAAPVDHATLVLRAGVWHKGNLDKAIERVGAIVRCDPPAPNEATSWLIQHAAEDHAARLDRDAAALLVDRVGVHLMALSSEVGRLAAAAGQGQAITRALVEQAVGRSSDEQAWAVQGKLLEGMGKRSAGMMIDAVRESIDLAGQPDVLVMYFAADLMRKLTVAAAMRREGAPESAINSALKLWGASAGQFHAVARRVDERTARGLFREALALDARSKSGFGEPTRNLERLCVAAAGA
jgi:DNA polymerase III subunit delta